jgi:hypothetical protein
MACYPIIPFNLTTTYDEKPVHARPRCGGILPRPVQLLRRAAATTASTLPKLVVVLVVDGLPNEQVQRYRDQFGEGGLRRMLDQGASFSNAHQAHGVTVTAIGHSAVLTGAYPYVHGIIGNNWIDPLTKKSVYCTEDTNYTYIGEETKPSDGTSPARLKVNTLGDELRYATGAAARWLPCRARTAAPSCWREDRHRLYVHG